MNYREKILEKRQVEWVKLLIEIDELLLLADLPSHFGGYDLQEGVRKSVRKALHEIGYRQVNRGKGWLPLDICVCTIPETEHWELEPEMMEKIKEIESVYCYDRNCVTHLCEITPSYCLYLIETRAIFKNEVDDRLSDEVDQIIRENITSDDWITYIHCYEIDRLAALPAEEYRFRHIGNPEIPFELEEGEDEDQWHERVMDEMRQSLTANTVV
jgi:hypothetical protein